MPLGVIETKFFNDYSFLQDYSDYYGNEDSGFSSVFPLWRDFGIDDKEENPNLFSPRK